MYFFHHLNNIFSTLVFIFIDFYFCWGINFFSIFRFFWEVFSLKRYYIEFFDSCMWSTSVNMFSVNGGRLPQIKQKRNIPVCGHDNVGTGMGWDRICSVLAFYPYIGTRVQRPEQTFSDMLLSKFFFTLLFFWGKSIINMVTSDTLAILEYRFWI